MDAISILSNFYTDMSRKFTKTPHWRCEKKKRRKKKNNKHCFLTKSSHTYIVGGGKKRGEKKEGNKPCTLANVRLQGYYGLYFFNKE